jgi:hypothetical protein
MTAPLHLHEASVKAAEIDAAGVDFAAMHEGTGGIMKY